MNERVYHVDAAGLAHLPDVVARVFKFVGSRLYAWMTCTSATHHHHVPGLSSARTKHWRQVSWISGDFEVVNRVWQPILSGWTAAGDGHRSFSTELARLCDTSTSTEE